MGTESTVFPSRPHHSSQLHSEHVKQVLLVFLVVLTWHVQGYANVDLVKEVKIEFSNVGDSSKSLSLHDDLVPKQNLLATPTATSKH